MNFKQHFTQPPLVTIVLLACLLLPVFTLAQDIPHVIRSLDWKPDGSQIAIGYDDGTVELVDPGGEVLQTFSFGDVSVLQVAWRPPDGEELAVLTTQSLTILDPQTETMRTDEFYAEVISWSPDGTMIASDGPGDSNPVYVSDATTFETVQTLRSEFHDSVGPVAWHPVDNDLVAAGMSNGEFAIWQVSTGVIVHNRRDSLDDGVTALSWNPNGGKLAIGYESGGIEIRDAADWTLLAMSGQYGVVGDLEWKPDGTQVASVGFKSVEIADSSSGETVNLILMETSPRDVSWNSDGTKLAYRNSSGSVTIVHTLRLHD